MAKDFKTLFMESLLSEGEYALRYPAAGGKRTVLDTSGNVYEAEEAGKGKVKLTPVSKTGKGKAAVVDASDIGQMGGKYIWSDGAANA